METRYENPDETRAALQRELSVSKKIIERRLPGKTASHFCFPWYGACRESAELACDAGYEVLHLGATCGFRRLPQGRYPACVARFQEEYLMHLPGKGRASLAEVFREKWKKGQGEKTLAGSGRNPVERLDSI